ncbi:sn-glycerol-3-phosphate ABC transporter ATP-binding protein UgpC [candidate division KSB1 bacterium]|nr:sn-glycerol-3-phosphate ABC transporter ATP-binding protein UgpC [candidate division KSB1 bacterium]
MAHVQLRNVTKIFDKNVVAVDKATVDIQDKEFVILVGPSGCGKSTTLRMIAGLEDITSGEIYIDDKLVNDVPPKDRDIAMVFQNYALYPHMTVYQNMAFGLKLRKFPKDEIDRRVNEAAEILEIKNLLHRRPKALSGGQRQRVAVGRAIVRKPKVFLFDEPLSNLDAKLRVQMRTEISKLHSRLETTMIYVTHDQMEAMTMGDRIVVMKDGLIQQIDSPLNLYNKPNNLFVAGFIGSPSMNFMEGTIKQMNGRLTFDEGKIQLAIPPQFEEKLKLYKDQRMTLGIRPENIYEADFAHGIQKENSDTVESMVEVVEPLGNEVFLYLNTGLNSYVARVAARKTPAIGQKISIIFNMGKAHFFDPKNQESIFSWEQ